MSEDADHKCESGDVLIPGPAGEDGRVPFVRHMPDHSIQVGIMSPAQDGKPADEIVALQAREDGRGYDVTPLHQSSRKGPAKVATTGYRDGWGRIWGAAPAPSDRPN